MERPWAGRHWLRLTELCPVLSIHPMFLSHNSGNGEDSKARSVSAIPKRVAAGVAAGVAAVAVGIAAVTALLLKPAHDD
ncbi:hypothetical protein HZH68_003590 [Vespula germanica]|uniref:Uncharacterized protein n=1 Tax=Vespula germanica TaxID=30212 RepID=A0A834NPB9_VESGE|nr:hypothetical protein HZH68_003590 [Vespula germanica]